jgi:hypothetical protein
MRLIALSLAVMNVLAFFYFRTVPDSTGDQFFLAADSALPASTKSLRLLSEANLDSVARTPIESPKGSAAKSEVLMCTIIGSFEKLLSAEYFTERLQALGLAVRIGEITVASKPNYWLQLSPESSRKEALRRLRELQRRGIDSYVIPSGDFENGISLGMFSDRDRALKLQQKIRAQGYQPKITEVAREQKEIWVFLPPGEAAKLALDRWVELMSSDQYLQKRQNFCSDLASARNFQ